MKRQYPSAITLFALIMIALLGATPANLRAATITVTSTADSGAGTLRAALANALDADTINFSLTLPATITLTSGELPVSKSVVIAGPGANELAVNGNHAYFAIFNIAPSNIVTISGLTIANGSSSFGGGINNQDSDLTISNCTVTGNYANFGGGFQNLAVVRSASLKIIDSTISSNTAGFAGAIYNVSEGPGDAEVQIVNSTISGNFADNSGGAIVNVCESAANTETHIMNSTFSDNSQGSSFGGAIDNWRQGTGGANIVLGSTILKGDASGETINNDSGTVISLGYNLSSDVGGGYLTDATDQIITDPMLGPLQDNGGPTFTHAPASDSPAIDHGLNFSGLATDQRGFGFVRSFDDPNVTSISGGDGTDIGAFEAKLYLVDLTPPDITCPSNVTVEFTSGAGTIVMYSVTAMDNSDPSPMLICSPPSGSMFPIGVTVVQCTAHDASDNIATNSFSITVLGAKGTHENVLVELRNFRSIVLASGDGKKINAAITQLAKSLDTRLWVDQTHLQPKLGKKVFQNDMEAVQILYRLIKSKKNNLPDSVLQGFIDRIIRADRLLASITIQEAIEAGVSGKKLERAQKYMAKSDTESGNAKYSSAIKDYWNAWKQVTLP